MIIWNLLWSHCHHPISYQLLIHAQIVFFKACWYSSGHTVYHDCSQRVWVHKSTHMNPGLQPSQWPQKIIYRTIQPHQPTQKDEGLTDIIVFTHHYEKQQNSQQESRKSSLWKQWTQQRAELPQITLYLVGINHWIYILNIKQNGKKFIINSWMQWSWHVHQQTHHMNHSTPFYHQNPTPSLAILIVPSNLEHLRPHQES
jgi:hypothetical protein